MTVVALVYDIKTAAQVFNNRESGEVVLDEQGLRDEAIVPKSLTRDHFIACNSIILLSVS